VFLIAFAQAGPHYARCEVKVRIEAIEDGVVHATRFRPGCEKLPERITFPTDEAIPVGHIAELGVKIEMDWQTTWFITVRRHYPPMEVCEVEAEVRRRDLQAAHEHRYWVLSEQTVAGCPEPGWWFEQAPAAWMAPADVMQLRYEAEAWSVATPEPEGPACAVTFENRDHRIRPVRIPLACELPPFAEMAWEPGLPERFEAVPVAEGWQVGDRVVGPGGTGDRSTRSCRAADAEIVRFEALEPGAWRADIHVGEETLCMRQGLHEQVVLLAEEPEVGPARVSQVEYTYGSVWSL